MPDCPNCGLATQRTKDWVCQWCGYPLVSNSYKVIDKTYKELQDERKASASPYAATQPEFVPEYKPEPKREPLERPVSQQRPAPAPYPRPQPSVDSDI
jgi:predicted amidophosphoribosyltransferase